MIRKIFTRPAVKRIALSAGKAFIAAAVPLLTAGYSTVTNVSEAKALILAALIAGGDAVLKAVQIAVES